MEAEHKAALLSLIPGRDFVAGRARARRGCVLPILFGHLCWPAQIWPTDPTVMQAQASWKESVGGGGEGCVDELSSEGKS